jgi:hypothetical protein
MTSAIPIVIEAEYRGGYRIRVTFHGGTTKTVDFERWLLGPIFQPLKDEAYFRRFFVTAGP